MLAMALQTQGEPLAADRRPDPEAGPGQVVVEVRACGVCRTDLHIVDGELPAPALPLVIGHQIVGTVAQAGPGVELEPGARVGVPWLAWACGKCEYCRSGRENLCPRARFTGLDVDGGYAERAVAAAGFCLPLSDEEELPDLEAAPLLCAGLIGHRALRKTGDPARLGLYGFGASAHLVCQVARFEGREVYAFTRAGDDRSQAFAIELGAVWAGDAEAAPPEPLDAAIIFAPVGALVRPALRAVRPGGTVVCAGIHMSDIPSFPYAELWGERTLCSVANLTRADGHEFLELAARAGVRARPVPYPLRDANRALADLRTGQVDGAAVLAIAGPAGRSPES
jgi:propanol-preferring alcohol dehydrogenase